MAFLVLVIAWARTLALRAVLSAVVPALVWAPNHGRTIVPVPGELRIDVGPPAASLAVALIEPHLSVRGTVFVLHGIRDSKESVRAWGERLASAGYRAVLVDLRGHGRSSGTFLSYGVVAPVASKIKTVRDKQLHLYVLVKQSLIAYMNGAMPQVAVEFGRKTIPNKERPSIDTVENETSLGGGAAREAA